ncbi:MAG: immunoglobulin domain-containing protein, partial [Clostridia bacterium]|nr:immunoglobulin domain-containing protein [Clostridia bacterium]
ATFKVVASGIGLSYQWNYQKPGETTWNAVSNNGTSATLSVTAAAHHNGYKYRVKVSNSAGSVWSNTVTLTVNSKPVITTQPVDKAVNEGETATFKVVATGSGLSYQWYYQKPGESTWNTVSSNGTSATLSVTAAARHNGYKYRVKVSNSKGYVWSNTVTLTVTSKPVITEQPSDLSVIVGAKATFTVTATGATSYQWYYQKPGENTWTMVSSNGTSAAYTMTVAARHNGYKYKCVVTNTAGSVESNVVTLTVK